MAGEAYALSHDLVQYLAQSKEVASIWHGKEDTKMAKYMTIHPRSSEIHWISEHCWIYDHPRVGTPYAHGFLFPDHVEEIRREKRQGLSADEIQRRGGAYNARSFSTTSKWKVPYKPPRPDLSMEETIEALVEGGGRWRDTWYRQSSDEDSQKYFSHDAVVFGANDPRLHSASGAEPIPAKSVNMVGEYGLTLYVNSSLTAQAAGHPTYAPTANPYGETYEQFTQDLMNRRYQDYKVGSTVMVHYCKKNEWFYETALALLGRERTWRHGSGGAGSEWRMNGSPIVQSYSRNYARIVPGRV